MKWLEWTGIVILAAPLLVSMIFELAISIDLLTGDPVLLDLIRLAAS